MSKPDIRVTLRCAVVAGVLLGLCTSCSSDARPDPRQSAPEARAARKALEDSLNAWRASPDIERNLSKIKPVMFLDQTRERGQRLRSFAILGELTRNESYRQFRVKLLLEEPTESTVTSYYVFGRGPIWVYREEDFDMIMHMDHSMMEAPPDDLVVPGGDGADKGSSGHHHGHESPRSPSRSQSDG